MCGRVIQLERGTPQNIIPANTEATATSRAIRAEGFNAIALYPEISDLTGDNWNLTIQGASKFNGTYSDAYDVATLLSSGDITASRVVILKGIPANLKIVATKGGTDAGKIKVDYELLTI